MTQIQAAVVSPHSRDFLHNASAKIQCHSAVTADPKYPIFSDGMTPQFVIAVGFQATHFLCNFSTKRMRINIIPVHSNCRSRIPLYSKRKDVAFQNSCSFTADSYLMRFLHWTPQKNCQRYLTVTAPRNIRDLHCNCATISNGRRYSADSCFHAISSLNASKKYKVTWQLLPLQNTYCSQWIDTAFQYRCYFSADSIFTRFLHGMPHESRQHTYTAEQELYSLVENHIPFMGVLVFFQWKNAAIPNRYRFSADP